jgi:soluble lytic murein transglycosylase-like protein
VAALKVLLALAAVCATPAAAEPVDRWAPYIAEASSRFDIPNAWIRRVMRLESGGRALADGRPVVSRAGAMGLMQLMPGTWRDMRALVGLGADRFAPRDNILAGTAYLRLIYDRFGYPGLFAAYNAGPSRYAAFLAGARKLPRETRVYVAAAAPAAGAAVRIGAITIASTGTAAPLFVRPGAGRFRAGDTEHAAAGGLCSELTGGAEARR